MPGYKKIRKIGSGGQAVIWESKNIDTGEIVALKYLQLQGDRRTRAAEIEERRIRFIREVRIQKSLHHDNIVPVLAYSDRGHHQWYAMPLAEQTLQKYLEGPRRDIEWALEVIHQVIHGIQHAHDKGVIHRDIKPSNVLQIGNKWLISDFGFCRDLHSESMEITRSEKFLGTLFYAAPEQYDDAHEVGPTADIYAVGKTLLHLLSWKPLSPYLKMEGVPDAFQGIIRKCVADSPDDRYQDIASLRTALLAAS
ncbi:protein kinase [Nonomuraea phyllanthi]|uniref:serine/threonine-protein kinase n=1 Tax=Nonomuraea phyllanthi TaxID=2219224 RepID=UPI00129405F6|nr:serine/threonine-protein kinase [Nonomuraea phyllanthi]QFY13165.1 protein kinase [Nonomuraea phyllanthi]